MNVNPELVASVGVFVGGLLAGWARAWVSTRKTATVARAAVDAIAKAICYEVRAEATGSLTSEEVISEYTRRAREYTTSEQLNKALMELEQAEILWNMEKVKVRAGDVTEW